MKFFGEFIHTLLSTKNHSKYYFPHTHFFLPHSIFFGQSKILGSFCFSWLCRSKGSNNYRVGLLYPGGGALDLLHRFEKYRRGAYRLKESVLRASALPNFLVAVNSRWSDWRSEAVHPIILRSSSRINPCQNNFDGTNYLHLLMQYWGMRFC